MLRNSVVVTVILFASAPVTLASSVASKNSQGNRFFEQGDYQGAEKAYVEAGMQSPDMPELEYNLGNSLIKQKKYDQALERLRKAISKGTPGLQKNGWFNLGNAMFETRNYKDAVQAYTQVLRLYPADRDAKRNLELALRSVQEQNQPAAGKDQTERQRKSEQAGRDRQTGKTPSRDRREPQPDASPNFQSQSGPEPRTGPRNENESPEESFSRERTLQLLDALRDQELVEQRRLQGYESRRGSRVKDW